MKEFELRVTVPSGTLLVGGYSPVPVGLDAAHATAARGPNGEPVPIIPATALRGALRQTLEAVLRGADRFACARGTGLPAEEDTGSDVGGDCVGDDGKPCVACQLFGMPAKQVGERGHFAALVLADAVARSAPPLSVRHGVGIDRRRRSAKEKILYDAQAYLPDGGLELVAEGRLLDPALESYLRAAVAGTTHVGGRRSRGFGRVDLAIEAVSVQRSRPKVDADAVELRVRLLAPAMLGGTLIHSNLRVSESFASGSTLRGAIGFALAEQLEDPDNDAAFQALVHAETGARFGFLYPATHEAAPLAAGVDARLGLASAPRAEPWPATARSCKRDGPAHGVRDVLLARIGASLLGPDHGEAAAKLERDHEERCPVDGCGAPLSGAKGTRSHWGAPATRTVTRVSMNRARDSARDGALFSHELLEAGVELRGVIDGIPKASRARLAEALAAPLSLGRGRSMGWGRIEVSDVRRPTELPGLAKRAKAFRAKLETYLASIGLARELAAKLVPITTLSPWVFDDSEDEEHPGEGELLGAFPEGSTVHLRLRRFTRVGRWEQRGPGQIPPRTAIAPGAVFVVAVPEGADPRESSKELERLEREGVGQWTRMGFGAVRAFDPFHVDRSI